MSHFFWLMLTLFVVLMGIGYVVAVTKQVSHKVDELPGGVYDSAKVIAEIISAKKLLQNEIELGRFQTSSTGDELRGQLTQTKDRLFWMIRQYDALREAIEKHALAAGAVGKAAVESSDVSDR